MHVCIVLERTNNCLFELASLVEVEELAGTKGEDHALVVFLQLIVDLGGYKSGELAVGEGFIFVESLTVQRLSAAVVANGRRDQSMGG